MTPIKRALRQMGRDAARSVVLAALFASTGCERWSSPQAGDEDANLGSYLVNVQYPDFLGPTIMLDPGKVAQSTLPIAVSVQCSGKNLPPDCNQNVPNWTSRKPPGADFLTVTFADPSAKETTATITLDVQAYLKVYGNDASSIGQHWFQVGLFPSSVPPNLQLSGKRDVVVNINAPQASVPDARQEQPPDKPRLSANPNFMGIYINGTFDPSQVAAGSLFYSGPDTQISSVEVSGPDASQFQAIAPATSQSLGAGSARASVQVKFSTADTDLVQHHAVLTITTDNKASVKIDLTGQRFP